MKKSLILSAILFTLLVSGGFAQTGTIEAFYGNITAVNVGFYSDYSTNGTSDIYCAVQVGDNQIPSVDIKSSAGSPILVITDTNPLKKEILTTLLAAQLNNQKVHLRTSQHTVTLAAGTDIYYNELLEASVGEPWSFW